MAEGFLVASADAARGNSHTALWGFSRHSSFASSPGTRHQLGRDSPCPGEGVLAVATQSLGGWESPATGETPLRALVLLGPCRLQTMFWLYLTLGSTVGRIGDLGLSLRDIQ